MKLTKAQIKQIIKEELDTVMKELEADPMEEEKSIEYDDKAAEAELQAKLAEPMHK